MSIHVPPYESVPFHASVIRDFQKRYGDVPDDYVSIDVETTGLDRKLDRIVQIGLVLVKGRKAVLSKSYFIDWSPFLEPHELHDFRTRLSKSNAVMSAKGKPRSWTVEYLAERGEPPVPIAESIRRDLGDNPYCVGHYAWNFDFPRLFDFMKMHASTFDVYPERLYDTCLTTRAAVVGAPPGSSERIQDFYTRIDRIRTPILCKLSDCVERFGFEKSGGVNLDSAHVADYDAWCSYLVLEKHREAACRV